MLFRVVHSSTRFLEILHIVLTIQHYAIAIILLSKCIDSNSLTTTAAILYIIETKKNKSEIKKQRCSESYINKNYNAIERNRTHTHKFIFIFVYLHICIENLQHYDTR